MNAQRLVRSVAIATAAAVITSLLVVFDAAANGTTLTVPYNNLTSGQPTPVSSIPMFEIKQAGGGIAGRFEITNSNSAAIALDGVNAGTGHGLLAWNYGRGRGAVVITSNSQNTLPALDVSSQSIGSSTVGAAADIRANNTNTLAPAARVVTLGAGSVLKLDNRGTGDEIATFETGGTQTARITRTGKGVFADGIRTAQHGITEVIPPADTASYTRGDVLVVATGSNGRVIKSTTGASRSVVGVVAGVQGVMLSGDPIASAEGTLSVGILGVFPVRVTTENGPIQRGDLLVTSATPGAAMRATSPSAGTILGKAMGTYNSTGVGTVTAMISLQ